MAKAVRRYKCKECGHLALQWNGQCPNCQAWNSLVEMIIEPTSSRRRTEIPAGEKLIPLAQVPQGDASRRSTGIVELDRTLSGGMVQGSVVLVGGDPGVGKSTLMMQLAGALATAELPAVYLCGEESPAQVRLRAERLGLLERNLLLLAETHVQEALEALKNVPAAVLVVDSIQSVVSLETTSLAGSPSQLRDCGQILTDWGKVTGIPTILIGHVTKEGLIAGPRMLEHMVDTVLYFEGDRLGRYRLLRCVKNRFGTTNEIGLFEMTARGLESVADPSQLFRSGGREAKVGAVTTVLMEGNRPLVVEVQALVAGSAYGTPQRIAQGIDRNRFSIMVAVAEKVHRIPLLSRDLFAKVVGGIEIDEPSADLALCAALYSSFLGLAVPPTWAFIGELDLAGEIRPVSFLEQRVGELLRQGCDRIFIPAAGAPEKLPEQTIQVRSLGDLRAVFDSLAPDFPPEDPR